MKTSTPTTGLGQILAFDDSLALVEAIENKYANDFNPPVEDDKPVELEDMFAVAVAPSEPGLSFSGPEMSDDQKGFIIDEFAKKIQSLGKQYIDFEDVGPIAVEIQASNPDVARYNVEKFIKDSIEKTRKDLSQTSVNEAQPDGVSAEMSNLEKPAGDMDGLGAGDDLGMGDLPEEISAIAPPPDDMGMGDDMGLGGDDMGLGLDGEGEGDADPMGGLGLGDDPEGLGDDAPPEGDVDGDLDALAGEHDAELGEDDDGMTSGIPGDEDVPEGAPELEEDVEATEGADAEGEPTEEVDEELETKLESIVASYNSEVGLEAKLESIAAEFHADKDLDAKLEAIQKKYEAKVKDKKSKKDDDEDDLEAELDKILAKKKGKSDKDDKKDTKKGKNPFAKKDDKKGKKGLEGKVESILAALTAMVESGDDAGIDGILDDLGSDSEGDIGSNADVSNTSNGDLTDEERAEIDRIVDDILAETDAESAGDSDAANIDSDLANLDADELDSDLDAQVESIIARAKAKVECADNPVKGKSTDQIESETKKPDIGEPDSILQKILKAQEELNKKLVTIEDTTKKAAIDAKLNKMISAIPGKGKGPIKFEQTLDINKMIASAKK